MPGNPEEQGAIKLAELIENAANNPESAAKAVESKAGTKGILGTIFDFIRDYKNKGDMPDKLWLERQFSKPEYADAWKGKDTALAAAEMTRDIEGYESAKKSLRTHMELGGSRESWFAEQIEIGAEANGKDPAEYAAEVFEGLDAARKENAEFLLGSAAAEAVPAEAVPAKEGD